VGLSMPALLTRYTCPVGDRLRASAPPASSLSGLMAAYHMGWMDEHGAALAAPPGKMVRSSLSLWACEAAGGDLADGLPAAVAVEWLHNFTLVHDDIEDGDRERRHRPAVWSIWGAGQGINAGDALHALAWEQLLAPGPAQGRRLRAGHVLARAVRDVIEGQCQDLALERRLRTRPHAYLRMARAKTGALLGASLQAGAILGGASRGVAGRLGKAGVALGLAFQVRDDWLGIWGEPERTGKSRDGDLDRRKVTYPVVAGYAAMTAPERRRLRTLFRRREADAVPEIRALLEACAAHRRAEVAARQFADEAILAVGECRLAPAFTREFEEFARYVASRSS
jgi:geranylgeranyl diphosphate synthase type I